VGVPFFPANLLPEGGVRDHIVRDLKLPNTDFDLLRAIGGECAGALSILSVDHQLSGRRQYRPLTEKDLADLAARRRQIYAVWPAEERPRLSLAGVQDKCPVLVRDDRYFLPRKEADIHLLPRLAGSKCGQDGWILVILDAEDDCPANLGAEIPERARACAPHHRISVVPAKREHEAWFIAAAGSLNGQQGFSFDSTAAVDPEAPRNAKGWIKSHMVGRSYGETTDQPAFTHNSGTATLCPPNG